MAKKEKRVVVDSLNVTLNEEEARMVEDLQYELRMKRSELIRMLIKQEYELMVSADHEEN